MPVRRWSSPLLLLVLAAVPTMAQPIATDPPTTWQAETHANKKAEKEAEKAARRAAPKVAARGAGRPDGGGMGSPGGEGPDAGGTPPDGGAGGGGPGGGPGGGGGGPGERASGGPMLLVRPEMEFAAPLTDSLLLYRTRESVVFGRHDSTEVVVLPLSGAAVQIAPGVQAVLHDGTDGMSVQIDTSNGIHVTYRYVRDPQDPDTLRVHVHAEPPGPSRAGTAFEVERLYRRGADTAHRR